MITPVIMITVSFATGIISGSSVHIPLIMLLIAISLSLFGCLVLIRRGQKPVYLIMLIVHMMGMIAFQNAITVSINDISRFADDKYVKVIGWVSNEPIQAGEYCRFTSRIQEVIMRGKSFKTCGSVSIFIKDTGRYPKYGNKISIYGKLSRIESTCNPGIASYRDLMDKKKLRCQMFPPSSGVKILSNGSGNFIRHISIISKNRLVSVIHRTMLEPYASLLGSIIFGSSASPLSNELQDSYRTAGVIHLLVVSGTQVSIIISVLLAICRYLGLSGPIRLVFASCANIMFAVMVGAGPSIIRAAVMSEAALVADFLERNNGFYNSIAISVLMLLMLDPLNIFDIGFQLSFLATWALFYIAPAIEDKLPKVIGKTASISIAPTIATSPVILYNFGQISFVSVFSNFLIIPWIEAIVVLGFASTLIGLVCLPFAWIINNSLMLILTLLNWIIYLASSLPFACRYFSPPGFAVILCYYLILMFVLERIKGKIKIRLNASFVVAAAVFAAVLLAPHFSTSAQDLIISFIDVGQGDSILIESPSGQKALIDAGGKQKDIKDSVARSIVSPFLRKKGINELALILLTHPHDDHVGGMPYILEKFKVGMVIDSGQPHASNGYYKSLNIIQRKKVPYHVARAGEVIDLGGGVKGYILHPTSPLIQGTGSDLNNNSIVVKIIYGSTSFLLVGDLAFEGEDRMLASGFDLKSDVLKVGHHGSRTSTSAVFLNAVNPRYAVISVGKKNSFGHPSGDTLNRLMERGIRVIRTDMDGAVVFRSDGKSVFPGR